MMAYHPTCDWRARTLDYIVLHESSFINRHHCFSWILQHMMEIWHISSPHSNSPSVCFSFSGGGGLVCGIQLVLLRHRRDGGRVGGVDGLVLVEERDAAVAAHLGGRRHPDGVQRLLLGKRWKSVTDHRVAIQ